jgi:NNP family nitrate/nitrite transporter-like MFS transporter
VPYSILQSVNVSSSDSSARNWYLLALAAVTHTFAAGIPVSSMPVLFEEISLDLDLGLVQIGAVWGMIGIAGVFVALLGGVLGDRFGVRLVLGLGCVLVGVLGAARGLSVGFISLTVSMFAFGLIRAIIPINVHKAVSLLFRGRNLGMANGVVSMGMGIGLMLGPLLSATLLSPLLGSWRQVLFLYGAVAVIVAVLWLLFGRMPQAGSGVTVRTAAVPMRTAISRLLRIKTLWLLGITLMLRSGCVLGMVGYLPLYLRERGWAVAEADGTLVGFFAVSTLAVIPISILSDRIGSRKSLLFAALVSGTFAVGLIPVATGTAVWVLVLTVGLFMDGFMAVILTFVQEIREIGPEYTGMALGLVFTFSQLGTFLSPPIGNSLAGIDPGLPFVFWAALSALAVISLALVRTKQ